MPNRMIKSTNRRSSVQLVSCLRSLFALELASPSQQLYLFSPWISDMPLIDNRFGQFRALIPDWDQQYLRLSTLFNTIAQKGTTVYIVCRPNQERTESFLRKLTPSIHVKKVSTLHEKGLISEHFYLRGSMNFTFSGININDEHVELTTEHAQVARAFLEAQQRWETLGQ